MRKQTKRKHWNLVDPITHAIVGASITDRGRLDKLRMVEYSALESITKGKGTIADWQTLVDVLNLAEIMGRSGVGPEVLPICEVAQDALHKAALRFQTTKKMGISGVGIKAIRELIEYADLQQSSIPRADLEKYIEKTRNKIKSYGAKVVEIV